MMKKQMMLLPGSLIFVVVFAAGCLPPAPGGPEADFRADVTSGSAPLTVRFTDLSNPGSSLITSWSWLFGDDAKKTGTEQDPVHTYTAAGTYNVSLTVTTANGEDTELKLNFISVTPSGEGEGEGEGEIPNVSWGTYLGGANDDYGAGIAVDGSGNMYVTGGTFSPDWVSNGWDTTYGDYGDGYVVKLNALGAPLWSTYLGGTSENWEWGIAVDASGNVYVTGCTFFPGWVSNGWDTTHNGGWDGYIVKLDTSGAHLWSTYLGGANDDYGVGIAVDASGNVYATGETSSPDWVSNGWDTTHNGFYDGYIVKLNTSGAHLWSTYLGGTDGDYSSDIAVDASGNVYATGQTHSLGWISNGWNTTNGGYDGYIVKLNTSGAHLWSTYLGGTNDDGGYNIAVDASGNVYATGGTSSPDWVSNGWDTTHNGGWDGYIVKLNTSGAHLWSTYLGGTDGDYGLGIAVDGSGNVYVTGETFSPGWVSNGWDTTHNGDADGFVLKIIDPAGAL